MAPAWETLTDEYKDSDSLFVSEVDCTSEDGKVLCEHLKVQGFPTIKYGSVHALEDYKGGRDLESLKKHAETIKPGCSPKRRDLCSTQEIEQLDELLGKSKDQLTELINEQEAVVLAAEEEFKAAVASLQESYANLVQVKTEKIDQVQKSGLLMMKMVLAELA